MASATDVEIVRDSAFHALSSTPMSRSLRSNCQGTVRLAHVPIAIFEKSAVAGMFQNASDAAHKASIVYTLGQNARADTQVAFQRLNGIRFLQIRR